MAEIEVKARVDDAAALLATLAQEGIELSAPVHQHDTVFMPHDWVLGDARPGLNVLRIREQAGETRLTLKQDRSGELDCLEVETAVGDAKATAEMLGLLGYTVWVEVIKDRRKARLNDIEICFDEVEGLGTFIELEKITEEDAAPVQTELWELLSKWGIPRAAEVLHGYDTLLRERQSG